MRSSGSVGWVVALLALGGCNPASSGEGTQPPVLRDANGSVTLLLNPPGDQGPRSECDTEVCTSLVGLIDSAQRTIDFALYGVRGMPRVRQALLQARERGVIVRGVVDRDADGTNYYADTDAVVAELGNVHDDSRVDKRRTKDAARTTRPTPRCPAPDGFEGPVQCLAYDLGDRCLLAAHSSREPLEDGAAIMHNKFFVIDSRHIWTGSTNVSDTGTGGYNANLVTVIDSRKLAAAYLQEVDQMFDKGRYHEFKTSRGPLRVDVGDSEVELLFSPQDSPIRTRVQPLIREAKERIDIAVFYLTHKHVTADLIAAHLRGVKVRVIIDATSAGNGFTKHELLRAVGIPVKVENWGGKMHMKSAMFDGHTVVTGSMNWTSSGDGTNDENVVLVHDQAIATQYGLFFDELWAQIDDRWLTGNPDPESIDSGSACRDGIDNDYDGLADAEDPGCGAAPPPRPPLPPWTIVDKGERMTCEPEMMSARPK